MFHSDLSEATFEKIACNVMELLANNTSSNLIKSAETTNVVVLRVLYCLTFVSIIVVNSILSWRIIFRLKKTRFNILFMFLSVSDISVAVTSIPILAIALFTLDKSCFIPCDVHTVFNYFPYGYSWILTNAIALDRCLVIIWKHKYEKFISKSRVTVLVVALLIFEAGRSFVYIFSDTNMRLRSQCILEAICMSITVSSYLYFLYNVRKNNKNATGKIWNSKSTNARLTRVIAYMFFCQVVLTLLQWINLVVLVTLEKHIRLQLLMNRRIKYRLIIILHFENSYLNACILLYNHYKEYKMFQRRNNTSKLRRNVKKANRKLITISTIKNIYRLGLTSSFQ